jgi:hypothetical protein
MATNIFETTAELYDYLTHLTGERNPSSATRDILMGHLNQAQLDMLGGGGILNSSGGGRQLSSAKQWSWVPVTEEILSVEPFETNTLSITTGSASATLSTAPAASRLGWFIHFDNSVYKIDANSGTSVTLDSPCASTTGSFTAKLYKLDYTLSTTNVMRMIDEPFRMSPEPKPLSVITNDAITDQHLYSIPNNRLLEALSINYSTDDLPSVRLPSISDRIQRVKFKFIVVPPQLDLVSEDPILPKRHRKLLAHLAAFYHLEKRDNPRAQSQLAIAKSAFHAMCGDQDTKISQQGKWMFAQPRIARTTTRSGSLFSWMKRRT